MDLEIQTRNTELDPDWGRQVRTAVERLTRRHPELIRMHVTLAHSAHHRLGHEEVAIVATLPRATVRVDQREAEMGHALRKALEAIARELDRVRRLRSVERHREPAPEN